MKIKHLTLLILAAISLLACKKAPEIPVVMVQLSNEVVTPYTRAVTITSNYSYPTELKDVTVIVSKNNDFSDAVTQKATTTASTIEVNLTGLERVTTYYYCFEYKSGNGSTKSSLKSFKTLDYSKPTVTTSEVTEITATSAKCGGNVVDDGDLDVTARGACWSTSQNPTISNNHTSDGNDLGNFTSSLTNLVIGTKYYVRAYATNSKGTNYGEQKNFTTKDGTIILTTSEITEITATTAKCGGNVVDDGGFDVTARGVCWSKSQSPTISNSHTSNGSGLGNFISPLTNLEIGTIYYVRAYATNSKGTNYGEQKSFTTRDGTPIVTTSEITEITATSAKCGGNITNDGGLTITARGVCWSTSQNPTISNSHTTNGSGLGNFTSSLTNLEIGTTYYVRAYATNSKGTNYGEQKNFTTRDGTPIVTTSEITEITATTAKCRGNVVEDEGFDVIARGVCWSKSQSPTISNSHTSDGSGLGNFTSLLTNLEMGTTYYVRAYATNSKGTSYGEMKSFETLPPPPIGSISGIFSVSSTKQVYFSQGNLQYQASTKTWRFAEHQYDYVGDANSNISSSYSGWIDLFGWGTSGQNTGAIAYQPYSISTDYSDYYPGGSYTNDLTYANKADWGYNAISNGGNTTMQWRTLTGNSSGEWNYLWNTRDDAPNKRGWACINGINGIVLLPDNWTLPDGISFNPNTSGYNPNTYSVSEWIIMENNGAVFLPAAGRRGGTSILNVGSTGLYWSSSYGTSSHAYLLYFGSASVNPSISYSRSGGTCVRLVQDL